MNGHNLENIAFLQQFLDESGKVNYNALKRKQNWLEDHVLNISKVDLHDFKNNNEEFVFYLNAYNLLTLKAVLTELAKNSDWKGNTSKIRRFKFFVLRKFDIGGKKISLYSLENKILRKKFKDPRIHFALNCASASCPVLPGKLFVEENLDEYLEKLSINFIQNEAHVRLDENLKILYLNPIFKWYEKDFQPLGIVNFIKKYKNSVPDNIQEFNIQFLSYDWSINS